MGRGRPRAPSTAPLSGVGENRLLALLPRPERELLRPSLFAVALARRERLVVAGEPVRRVYFPIAGMASLMGQAGRAAPIEVGVVGREGFVGLPIVLADGIARLDIVMQLPGTAWALSADQLREAMATAPNLRSLLLRYARVSAMQAAGTVIANGRASVAERLARWLLMCHDRVEGDTLELTHEFLALMLGVRRAGVTTALREYERRGFVGQQRGRIVIINRDGLIEGAGGFYGMPERELERLLPPIRG